MTYHTGTTNTVVGATNYGHVQYRHIEDLWANVFDTLEGAYSNNSDKSVRVISSPNQFGGYYGSNVGDLTGTNFTTMFVLSTIYGLPLPSAGTTSHDDSRTHDISFCNNADTRFQVGGGYQQNDLVGIFHFVSYQADTANGDRGARLMKLPA